MPEYSNGIKEAVETLKRDRDGIFERLREKDLEVAGMMKDVETLKGNVSGLSKDVAQIKNTISIGTGMLVLVSFLSPFLARWLFG